MFNDKTAKTSKADLELAQVEANNIATLQNATKYSDLLTTAAKNGVLGVADTVGSVMQTIKGSITDLLSLEGNLDRLKFLDQESAKINEALGTGSKKADEFRKLIADSAPKFAELGLSINEVQKQYVDLSSVFGTNISISDERMAELAATSKVTGISAKDLASSFRGVGVNLSGVADKMMDVTKVAKESGAIVRDVADKVTSNIGKMNMYNFEGGIKGLAKMSAQSSKLGIDMGKIFEITEKVFNPEGAIEMAAGLQRLGVQTSALTDPLKLMDLSANDPAELQNQIVKMSKDFVSFNKNLGEFQIMPGEKRRLREVAKELGMTSDELAKMGINAANLDYKMKQIKFAPGTSKEDREMIATMAQINKQGVAEVKVKQFVVDEKTGKKDKWTGEYVMKEVTDLQVNEIQSLKESQELQGKSMEELAIDQLSSLQSIDTKISATLTAMGFGAATTSLMQTGYEAITTGVRKAGFEAPESPKGIVKDEYRESENIRVGLGIIGDRVAGVTTEVENLYNKIKTVSSVQDLKDLASSTLETLGKAYSTITSDQFFEEMGKDFKTNSPELETLFRKENTKSTSSVNNTAINTSNNAVSSNDVVNNNMVTPSNIQNKPLESKIDLTNKVDVNVTMDPSIRNEALTTLMADAIRKYYEDPSKMANFIKEINKIQTNSNLIPAWYKPK
jgi:hypothetical protein